MKKIILIYILLIITGSAVAQEGNIPWGWKKTQDSLTSLRRDVDSLIYPADNFLYTADGKLFLTNNVKKIIPMPEYEWIFPTMMNWTDQRFYISKAKFGTKDWSTPQLVRNSEYTFRDPSIIQVGDTFYLAFTKNAFTNINSFSMLKSIDLINWVDMPDVSVLHVLPNIKRVWAPEWFQDSDGSKYIIVSCSNDTITGFQAYILKALNNNFTSWTLPKKLQVDTLNNLIDSHIIKKDGTYHLFYKNENTKVIEKAVANKLYGSYTRTKSSNWAGWGTFVEGQAIVYNKGKYRIYLDKYNIPKTIYSESTDLDNWTPPVDLNVSLSHGTPFRINKNNLRIIK